MKKIITIILLFAYSTINAADYYFSQASGDDTRTAAQAQNPATPWKSLTKAQTVFTTGNRLYFQRGETWYGNLTAQGSGTSGARIFVGAYGTGAKPIITGFSSVTSWVNTGNKSIGLGIEGEWRTNIISKKNEITNEKTNLGFGLNVSYLYTNQDLDSKKVTQETELNVAFTNSESRC